MTLKVTLNWQLLITFECLAYKMESYFNLVHYKKIWLTFLGKNLKLYID